MKYLAKPFMKIAIVHDFLNQYGGAERTLEALHEAFPQAPIFTSIFLPENFPSSFKEWDVRTSFMQGLPFLKHHFKKYLPLYPLAFRRFDLTGFDVILSSSSAFAKGVHVPKGARHICYCYSPMRFVWDRDRYFERESIPFFLKPPLSFVLEKLKRWDLKTNDGVGRFIGISEHIRQRIRHCYGKEADVLYPPVEVDAFDYSNRPGDYYLIVSRLNPYKRIELAIEACERTGRRLKIVGRGPFEPMLRRVAGPHTEFLGGVSFQELKRLLVGARAFIFPGEEDFGIAPVEAMAAGRPVIALARGGALETVVEGKTGLFFESPTIDCLSKALILFERMTFDPSVVRRHAERFNRAVFVNGIRQLVQRDYLLPH
jgi:glycosyltransferase involved in cell wall biosynthesis